LSLQSIGRCHDSSRVEPAWAALGSWSGLQGRWSRLHFLGYRASRTGDRVSGSLAYPAPPNDLWPSPARVSGGFPSRRPPAAEAAERRPSWPLPLLQSARRNVGTDLRWFLLSWDWGPCHRCTSHASTPGSKPVSKLTSEFPSDRRRRVPVLVPSSWFRTTSTVFSACELRVCCTPQPVEGSPRFMRACRGSPEGGRVQGSVPAVQFAPSEEFPSSAAGNASLRPLPSCRCRPARRGSAGRNR
jgi:hypothetical protein